MLVFNVQLVSIILPYCVVKHVKLQKRARVIQEMKNPQSHSIVDFSKMEVIRGYAEPQFVGVHYQCLL
ncbi:UNVERIFIED_CONTAM: hypothetical protein ABIC26_004668 [Paenibacillus sp. PvR008]